MHVIDCSVPPFIPDGWSYRVKDQIPGRVTGIFIWSPYNVMLHEENAFKDVGDFLKRLASTPLLPANVLDYLLLNPALIPSGWAGKHVHFCTEYRDAQRKKCVRCLFGDGVKWGWDISHHRNDWCNQFAVAELNSRPQT